MPTVLELKQSMSKAALDAQEIVDSDRTMAEKKTLLDKAEADIKAFAEQIKDAEYLAEKRKQFSGLAESGQEPVITPGGDPNKASEPGPRKSLGQQLVESEEWKAIRKAAGASGLGSFEWKAAPVELKATLTETTGGGITGSGLAQPDVQPGILSLLFQPLTIADLIPNGTTGSALVRYLKETVATNAAAAVAEGAAKPESTLNFSAVDEPVRKIATWLKVTDEMFEDVPQLRSYVDARLQLFVRIQEEAQLLTGSGVAPNVTGFLNRSGLTAAQALGADTAPDAIYKEITKIRVASFLEPDGIVLNPNNWQTIRLAKDLNNQYYGGGPFTAAYGNGGPVNPAEMLWGKRVVSTTAMTSGSALIGAFAAASQLFRRGGLTVEATNSNEDDFKNNLVMIRAEERLALACYRPAAFGTVTGLL